MGKKATLKREPKRIKFGGNGLKNVINQANQAIINNLSVLARSLLK